jgi:preprotein translocase subunit SecG
MLYSLLIVVDVLIAIAMVGFILLQQGKGASAGAAFGGGASGTVFGARGSASFLSRTTAVLATLFFINSLGLAYLASNQPTIGSVVDKVQIQTKEQPAPLPEQTPPASPSDVPQ